MVSALSIRRARIASRILRDDRIFVADEQVLGDLLGDRRSAARALARAELGDIIDHRAGEARIIDAAMLEEGLVLGREIGVDQQARIFVERQLHPPLAREAVDRHAVDARARWSAAAARRSSSVSADGQPAREQRPHRRSCRSAPARRAAPRPWRAGGRTAAAARRARPRPRAADGTSWSRRRDRPLCPRSSILWRLCQRGLWSPLRVILNSIQDPCEALQHDRTSWSFRCRAWILNQVQDDEE